MRKSKLAHAHKTTAIVPVVVSTNLAENSASSDSQRHAMVSEAAYYRAQRRGFEPGHELQDWLAAEDEINACSSLGDLQPPSPSG